MQLRNAEEYPALCDVVGVTICDFALWPETDENGHFKVPMLSRWRMQEQHGGEKGLPQVQYAFLELPKYAAGDAPGTLIDKWAYFFREAKNLEVVPPALSEGPFREALEVARRATFTAGEWEAYDRAKMAEQDARGALTLARKEALAEGRIEGRVEGRTEGRVEGIAEAKRDALLLLLASRGLSLADDELAHVAGCADAAVLDRWFTRALVAKTTADVFS